MLLGLFGARLLRSRGLRLGAFLGLRLGGLGLVDLGLGCRCRCVRRRFRPSPPPRLLRTRLRGLGLARRVRCFLGRKHGSLAIREDFQDADRGQVLAMALLAAVILPAALLEDDDLRPRGLARPPRPKRRRPRPGARRPPARPRRQSSARPRTARHRRPRRRFSQFEARLPGQPYIACPPCG